MDLIRGRIGHAGPHTTLNLSLSLKSLSLSQPLPPALEIAGQEAFVVERFLKKRGTQRKLEYLVLWKGWNPEDATWQKAHILKSDLGARTFKAFADALGQIPEATS